MKSFSIFGLRFESEDRQTLTFSSAVKHGVAGQILHVELPKRWWRLNNRRQLLVLGEIDTHTLRVRRWTIFDQIAVFCRRIFRRRR